MKRERFSSVGGPSASTLLSSLWSSFFRTSAMPCSSSPRSSTIPVAGSGRPRTVTSARKEWPWISSLASPSVVPGSACAASNRNDFVNSHIGQSKFDLIPILSDTKRVVCLQAEPPLRVAQTIIDRAGSVLDDVRPVHRLQRKPLEGQIDKRLGSGIRLRVNQFEFMASAYRKLRAGLGADADPVHAVRRLDRAIGLDPDAEAMPVQRIDQVSIDLQQRFATGQYHVAVDVRSRPLRGDGIGEHLGGGVAAAQRSVGPDKIGVAKPACCGGAILLAAAPEIAAREPAKHGGPAGVGAFALQGQEDFLDRVTHRAVSFMAKLVCRSASPNAIAAVTATLSERMPGRTGITSRASAALATSSGTPADSRPNSRMSASP